MGAMTPAELARRLPEVQVVDVRWPNEWEAGRIEGAVHVPEDDLDDRLDDVAAVGPVVTVCRSGHRSARAAERLREEGVAAENLDGGVLAWAAAGLPLVAADGSPGTVAEPEPPPDDRPEEHKRFQAEFFTLLAALPEEFGHREPTEEEARGFLRRRLVAEGRSEEDADAFLAGLDTG